MGKDPRDAAIDLVIADKAESSVIISIMREDDVVAAMKTPWVSFDTDSGARAEDGPLSESKSHPRAWGTFTRVLGKYVREDGVLTLEEAVRKATSQAAIRVGIADRGLVRPGMFADLVVFDPATVKDVATFEQPNKYSAGMRHVLVNGKAVVANGAITDERPGRAAAWARLHVASGEEHAMARLPWPLRASSLASACSSPEPPKMTYPTDEEDRPRRHLPRRGRARSVPLARRRHLRRDGRLGRGAERGHVRAPRDDPVPRGAHEPARAALQLPEVQRAGAPRHDLLLHEERRAAEPGRDLHASRGSTARPTVLLDPNTLSPDGTTKLAMFSVSKDGALAVYGLSQGGSDWMEYRVLDVATKQPRDDVVQWVKVSGAAWAGDGFFYSRYPARDRRQGPVGQERRPPGLLPPRRHAAVGRRAGLRGPGQSRALPHASTSPKTSASPSSPCRIAARARRATPSSTATWRRRTRRSSRSWPRSATTPSRSSTTSARHVPRLHRPQGAQRPRLPVRSEDARPSPAGRTCCRNGPEPLDGVAHRRRQAVCELPEGRDVARLRVRPERARRSTRSRCPGRAR